MYSFSVLSCYFWQQKCQLLGHLHMWFSRQWCFGPTPYRLLVVFVKLAKHMFLLSKYLSLELKSALPSPVQAPKENNTMAGRSSDFSCKSMSPFHSQWNPNMPFQLTIRDIFRQPCGERFPASIVVSSRLLPSHMMSSSAARYSMHQCDHCRLVLLET